MPVRRASLVTVDLLQKIGFKVDLQLSDWGSVATRRQKKDPPTQGGWNLFHTSANGAQLSSPLTSPSTITTCDGKNFPGWPCDQLEEEMRLRYIREPDAAKRMALLQDMHRRFGMWYPIFHSVSSCSRFCGAATSPAYCGPTCWHFGTSVRVAEAVTIFSGASSPVDGTVGQARRPRSALESRI